MSPIPDYRIEDLDEIERIAKMANRNRPFFTPVMVLNLVAEVRQLRARVAALEDVSEPPKGVNWSEHVYPLVAALKEAGYEGEAYNVARERAETLHARVEQLKTQRDAARGRLNGLAVMFRHNAGTSYEALITEADYDALIEEITGWQP